MRTIKFQANTSSDREISQIVNLACQTLKDGGLVIFPTETVYGAGVDATNPEAVAKLLRYKSRREGKPLSIAVTNLAMAEKYAEINDQARRLYQQFMPGPVTIISKDRGLLAPGVASEFATVGTRIPDYRLITKIVETFGKPITATSANASGKKRPYAVSDLLEQLSQKQRSQIDLIIDAGKLPTNPPSTVIDTTLSAPVTLRSGSIDLSPNSNSKADQVLISNSEAETKQIAGRYLLKHWDKVSKSGLIIGLDGALGVGKTVFTKGVAEFLGIQENLTSPTYTYIEEYDFKRHQTVGKLFHLDVWKINSPEEFALLDVAQLLKANSVVVVEWFSQVEKELSKTAKKAQIPVIGVRIAELDGELGVEERSQLDTRRQLSIIEKS